MHVILQAAGQLAPYLRDPASPPTDGDAAPSGGTVTRRLELARPEPLGAILGRLGIPAGLVAFGYSDGTLRRLDYTPRDGETITLQKPAAGG